MTKVLDKGSIELIDSMASDLQVVAAARVSNGALFETASKGEEKDFKLISYLMKHRHGTPFEHSVFTFYIDCPLFVAREWHRHRIASYNEVSRRYTDSEPKFYFPDRMRIQDPVNKQGSITLESNAPLSFDTIFSIKVHVMKSVELYNDMLKAGIAREMARIVLPQNMYTQFYFTVNSRSLMNFIELRNSKEAQLEIQQYAQVLETFFAQKMPLTWKAFIENDRKAP